MVKNSPPSLPSRRIQPSCASQPSGSQLSVAGEVGRVLPEDRAWIGSQVLHAILPKPALHFSERVSVLLGVLVLIAEPRHLSWCHSSVPTTTPPKRSDAAYSTSPDVPYLLVEIDDAWRIPWDRHPNAHAAQLLARAIVARLRAPSTAATLHSGPG